MKDSPEKLHKDFAVLIARMVVRLGTERAVAVLLRTAGVIDAEARKSGHSPAAGFGVK